MWACALQLWAHVMSLAVTHPVAQERQLLAYLLWHKIASAAYELTRLHVSAAVGQSLTAWAWC